MLLDEREAKTGADPGAPAARRSRTAGEAFEDAIAIRRRYAGPGIVDVDPNGVVTCLNDDLGHPSGVTVGVLDEVPEDALDPALVDGELAVIVGGVDRNGQRRVARRGDGVADEVADLHRARREVRRASVESRSQAGRAPCAGSDAPRCSTGRAPAGRARAARPGATRSPTAMSPASSKGSGAHERRRR